MSVAEDRPLRVALTTLGCKVNFAEMAELAGALAAAGCDVVSEDEHADVRVLNSCTVTMQADATTRQRLRRLRRQDPQARMVLTGCSVDTNLEQYLPADGAGRRLPAAGLDAVFPNARKHEIADYVIELGTSPRTESRMKPPLRSRAFLKVQDGCNHRCTYCIVWRARGESTSVPSALVLERAQAAVDQGHAELVLSGVDLGSYGRDIGTDLPSLLTLLLDKLGDTARLRLSSINANDVTPRLIELNEHPHLCAHWHMPLQSGSDHVLRAMHRGYRRAQYLRVVQALRERDPFTEFTSDVMVGFPGETEADHCQTLSLIDDAGFLACHVFRWSPRPGTPATDLEPRVGDATARRRSAEVRRAALRTGDRSRRRACGRVHEVVWDRVDGGVAHGISATYHEVTADASAHTQPARLARVLATGVDGETLRATVLPQ